MINVHRFVAALLAIFLTPCVFAAEVHVAPDGNDAWSGELDRPNATRTDGPVATLGGARDVVRKLRAAGTLKEPVRIIVAGGRYEFTTPLVLTPEDSGPPESPVSFEAASNTKPVFSGGRMITGFKPAQNGIWQTSVPEVAAGKWYFEQLFVDGQRATRARTPNAFWSYLIDVKEEAIVAAASGDKRPTQARQTVTLRPERLSENSFYGLECRQLA